MSDKKKKIEKLAIVQFPICIKGSGEIVGNITIAHEHIPRGVNWGLQPGLDDNGKIIAFGILNNDDKIRNVLRGGE